MPKLNKTVAKRVAGVDPDAGGNFEALEPGTYTGRLSKVDEKTSSKGNEMWVWEFDELLDEDGNKAPGRLWVNTVLLPQSDWVMAQAFHAFGYTPDSDTDEIVGERCGLVVSKRVIEQGTRKGQMGNNVDRMIPIDGASAKGDDEEDDEVF